MDFPLLEHVNRLEEIAESAAKEADDKAKEAGLARAQAAAAAQQAMQLRQQAGQAFCSPAMGARLTALMHQTANAPNVRPPPSPQAEHRFSVTCELRSEWAFTEKWSYSPVGASMI